jgi:hypothetical protein
MAITSVFIYELVLFVYVPSLLMLSGVLVNKFVVNTDFMCTEFYWWCTFMYLDKILENNLSLWYFEAVCRC